MATISVPCRTGALSKALLRGRAASQALPTLASHPIKLTWQAGRQPMMSFPLRYSRTISRTSPQYTDDPSLTGRPRSGCLWPLHLRGPMASNQICSETDSRLAKRLRDGADARSCQKLKVKISPLDGSWADSLMDVAIKMWPFCEPGCGIVSAGRDATEPCRGVGCRNIASKPPRSWLRREDGDESKSTMRGR